MQAESKKFLHELLAQCCPSGFEADIQNVWEKRTKKFADATSRDVHGNTVGILNPKAKFKIMLAGHCDEIGFIISHINKLGYLHIMPIGGIDPGVLPGTQVKILTDKGRIDGIIGKKAIHLMTVEERGKVLEIKNLWVDIGAKDEEDAKKLVKVGDPITYAPNLIELQNNTFTSKACDNRMGAFVVSEVIKLLSKKKLRSDVGVYAASTVQEEVGLRGAMTSAFGIDPQVAFAVDVGFASDMPGIDKRTVGECKIGGGPILHAGPVVNRVLGKMIIEMAEKKKIPYQMHSLGRPGGTDTAAIQVTRQGVATALVAIPNRYMHTMVELCSYDDLVNAAELISETILKITPKTDFVPR